MSEMKDIIPIFCVDVARVDWVHELKGSFST
jgi:hypothetical protein